MKLVAMMLGVGTSFCALAKPIDLACMTRPYPSTTFSVQEKGSKVIVDVIVEHGVEYMPVWRGLVTPADLAKVKEAATILPKLGSQFSVSWDVAGCKSDGDQLFECGSKGEDVVINGMKVHPWALIATDVMETTASGIFVSKSIILRMDIDGKSLMVSMNYRDGECVRLDNLR